MKGAEEQNIQARAARAVTCQGPAHPRGACAVAGNPGLCQPRGTRGWDRVAEGGQGSWAAQPAANVPSHSTVPEPALSRALGHRGGRHPLWCGWDAAPPHLTLTLTRTLTLPDSGAL